jgi:hypothetical protein
MGIEEEEDASVVSGLGVTEVAPGGGEEGREEGAEGREEEEGSSRWLTSRTSKTRPVHTKSLKSSQDSLPS